MDCLFASRLIRLCVPAVLVALVCVGCPRNEGERIAISGGLHPSTDESEIVTHDLRYRLMGEENEGPVVLLENGLGDKLEVWDAVQPAVAAFAPVVAYDRGGVGGSQPGPNPRSARMCADEAREMLQKLGFEPPYVLVGHSIGGLFVRFFAMEYPDEVAAIVLVDSRHEYLEMEQMELLPWKAFERLNTLESLGADTMGLGVLQEWQARFVTYFEVAALRNRGALPEVPFHVLSATQNGFGMILSPDENAVSNEIIQWVQNDLAGLLPNTAHEWIDSKHEIHQQQPQVVIDAIEGVYAKCARK